MDVGRVGGGSSRTRKGGQAVLEERWSAGDDDTSRRCGDPEGQGPSSGGCFNGWRRMEQDDNVRREAGEAAGLPSDSDKEAQVRTKDTKALSAAMTVVGRVDREKGDAYGLQDARDDVDDVVVSGLQCSDSVCRQHKRTQADGGMDLIMGAGVYSIAQGRPGPSECDARRCAQRARVCWFLIGRVGMTA